MTAYYNEIDPKAAAWLRELIKRNLIAPGDVDERSILDVRPDDIAHYTQAHFFAGIGGWSYALRLAGWPDDRPVWTGSCPCQPFSAAGRRVGLADERHLWPAWFWLISQRKPCAIFGEQVASRDGYDWLDAVRDDMEGKGYSIGAVDLCAAGFGAPHIRQRLYFVADAEGSRHDGGGASACGDTLTERDTAPERGAILAQPAGLCKTDGRADTERRKVNGFWGDADWLRGIDDNWRPVEPGTFPLAHGAPARMGRLRGYGNAINAETARHFIAAYMEVTT